MDVFHKWYPGSSFPLQQSLRDLKLIVLCNWFIFSAISILIISLTLMDSESLKTVYLLCAQLLAADPAWVKKNSLAISNVGHLVSSFFITCLGFYVFRAHYLKSVAFAAALILSGELLQNFTATRQPNLEDIAYGFSGVALATVAFCCKKTTVPKG